jgi:hypothetical protein
MFHKILQNFAEGEILSTTHVQSLNKDKKVFFNVTEVNYHFVNFTLNFATLKHHCNMFQ